MDGASVLGVVAACLLIVPIIVKAVLATADVTGAKKPVQQSSSVIDDEPSIWETMDPKEVVQVYEHALTQGLTPSLELMAQAAVACARCADSKNLYNRNGKKSLRLMDSLTLQGYEPTDPAGINVWAKAYVGAQRWRDAAALLQAPMRNAIQDHVRHYYLCNIYIHTNDAVNLKRVVAERKGQHASDLMLVRAFETSERATEVEHHTYRVILFAYSGDMQSALAERGRLQYANIEPTELQYKALKCACELNDRFDMLPIINEMSKQ
jgi:hypothetical protein